MAYGLQAWLADGTKFVDTTLKAGRFVAKGTTTSTSVSVPEMTTDGTWHVFAYVDASGGNYINVTINNGSFSMPGTTGQTKHYFVIWAIKASDT